MTTDGRLRPYSYTGSVRFFPFLSVTSRVPTWRVSETYLVLLRRDSVHSVSVAVTRISPRSATRKRASLSVSWRASRSFSRSTMRAEAEEVLRTETSRLPLAGNSSAGGSIGKSVTSLASPSPRRNCALAGAAPVTRSMSAATTYRWVMCCRLRACRRQIVVKQQRINHHAVLAKVCQR